MEPQLTAILGAWGVVTAALIAGLANAVFRRNGNQKAESFPVGTMARREAYIDKILSSIERLTSRIEATEAEHRAMVEALTQLHQVGEKVRDSLSEIHLGLVKLNGKTR